MAKQKTPPAPSAKAKPPGPPKGAPSQDVMAQFDRMREEYIALREVADKAAEAAEAKFEELVAFATENGITDEPEGEGGDA